VRPFYLPATLAALYRHRSAGREIVFVSGSSVDILAPIALELDVHQLLATRQRTVRGRYTGEIEAPQTIGTGKAEAVRRFLTANGNDGSTSFAYGDHDSDVPMLSVVGHPVIVSRQDSMRAIAHKRSWSVLDPFEPDA
jgi:HAD superfamily hydrolase (TIGR01490 family)